METQTAPTVADTKPTAKTFREPLLKVLGSLNNYITGATVNHTDVYPTVLALLGMAADSYGIAPGTEALQTHRWIQFAYMSLKDEGLGLVPPRKGQWGLTEEGVQAARVLAGLPRTGISPMMVPVQPASPRVPKVYAQKPEFAAYATDPYLRSLAIAQSKCIGFFSVRAETCAVCPLQIQCKHLQVAHLSRLAADLRKKEAPPEPVAATTTATASAVEAKPKSPIPPNAKRSKIACQIDDAVCIVCSTPILKGNPCYWIQSNTGGLVHPECQ